MKAWQESPFLPTRCASFATITEGEPQREEECEKIFNADSCHHQQAVNDAFTLYIKGKYDEGLASIAEWFEANRDTGFAKRDNGSDNSNDTITAATTSTTANPAYASSVLRNMHNLRGMMLLHQGGNENLVAANDSLVTALGICKRKCDAGFGHDSFVDIAGVMNDLGVVLALRGEAMGTLETPEGVQFLDEAVATLKHARYLAERAYNPDRDLKCSILCNLSRIHSMRHEQELALDLSLLAAKELGGAYRYGTDEGDGLISGRAVFIRATVGAFLVRNGSPGEGTIHLVQAVLDAKEMKKLGRQYKKGESVSQRIWREGYHATALGYALLSLASCDLAHRKVQNVGLPVHITKLNEIDAGELLESSRTILTQCLTPSNPLSLACIETISSQNTVIPWQPLVGIALRDTDAFDLQWKTPKDAGMTKPSETT